MNILITGGAGFIGSYVAKRLVDRGDQVVLLDDFNDFLYTSDLKRARIEHFFSDTTQVKLIEGSILDEGLVDDILREEKCERVIHLAAHANPGRSVEAPELYTEVNVQGTLKVLHAAQHNNVKQLIFAGSSSVYNDTQTPFREDRYPLRPKSPYGASKAAAEVYCSMWHELHSLPVTILRFFSVYGPLGRPDMAPMILADRLLQGKALEITRDRQRDFTYIDDVVDSVLAALDKVLPFEIINIGRGQPVDLMSFVKALESAIGTKAQVEMREAPPGEMRVTYADISKAKKLLGYEPKVSIEEGVQKLVHWMRDERE